jgi:hypothetical protein
MKKTSLYLMTFVVLMMTSCAKTATQEPVIPAKAVSVRTTPALAFFAAILGLYTAAALFESIRIGKSDWLYLFLFIAGANISSGLGAINGALFGDSAKSYGLYTRT